MGINIIFLSIGDKYEMHLQTYFAIITTLKYKGSNDFITVYTDHPEKYKRLKKHIKIKELSTRTISEWLNGTGYFFRAKIKAIEEAADSCPDNHLLFLDSDTFVFDRLDSIREMLDRKEGVMNVKEGHPLDIGGKHKKMYNAIKGKRIGNIEIGLKHEMWNSGVIGIPNEKLKAVIPLALQINDFITREYNKCFTIEQYAVSIAMSENMVLNASTKYIGHYWGNRELWLPYIGKMLATSFVTDTNVEQEIADIDPIPLREWPVYVKSSNTKRRLTNLLSKIFPNKIYSRDR